MIEVLPDGYRYRQYIELAIGTLYRHMNELLRDISSSNHI